MALYFLSYDLRGDRDYKKLYEELVRLGAKRMLESVWCFQQTDTSPAQLRDHLTAFVDQNDGVLVSEVKSWASLKVHTTPKNLG